MTYEYQCTACKHIFDVIKSYKDMEVSENCPKCGEFAERQFVPDRLHLMRTRVEHPEYNPGLGCVVRNSSHRKALCKQMGLEEVGNQDIDSWSNKGEKDREERLDHRYEEAFKEAKEIAQSPSAIENLGGLND